ncbi:MAG: response regulator [Draconibacterium sp.]
MTANKNYLIFVVDDNKILNRVTTEHLKKNGYFNVRSFFSGEECLNSLKKRLIPDIVVEDYNMTGMNGIDVLKAVKKKHPLTQFIFLTSNDDIEIAVNTIKYGAFDYIVKDSMAMEKLAYKIDTLSEILQLQKNNTQIGWLKIALMIVVLLAILLSGYLYFVLAA